ncbi:MAG: IclR family transcriptional regulator [Nocardioidaceae bacterium]
MVLEHEPGGLRAGDDERTDAAGPNAVLTKARVILEAFDGSTPILGVSELARRCGLPKTTVHRLARGLADCELLERDGDRYRLGPWLFELGQKVPAHRRLRVAAAPFLEGLSRATKETVVLGVPGHGEIFFSEKYVGSRGRGQVVTQIAGRVPMTCGASGKVVLAFGPAARVDAMIDAGLPRSTPFTITDPEVLRRELETVREQEYAAERQELVVGYGAVAAPVWSEDEVIATLTVVAPVSRLDTARFSVAVRLAAESLSVAIRGPRP